MELRVLQYFLAVAQEQNITRAAEQLHLTQPTLSRQLMQLEQELGTKLFHRGRHCVTLTQEGMLLRRRAQEIVDLAQRTRQEFCSDGPLRGEVAVGSGDLESMAWLAKILASFQAQHSQVTYQIYSGNSDSILERIERGVLDFGLLLEPIHVDKYDWVTLPVQEKWGILVHQQDPLAQKQSVCARDLAGVPLIISRRQSVQTQIAKWFGMYEPQMRVVACGNLPYNMALLVAQHMGAFVTIQLRCDYQDLRFVPLSPPLFSKTMLVWKKTAIFPPATHALIAYIQNMLAMNQ